nr:MAG TPA: integrase [Caudoviricetes sp.]DAR11292.1 MAG TPA: integrase [Caudoviricetes sp.]
MFVPRWHKPYTLGAPLTPGAVQALDPCTKFYPGNLRGRGILPHSYSIGN